ncbi:MAG: TVP38/TMEM64 family protein [Woeseia sp.]|jgi:uncharacterized membrane protein YdjX (TVP38/TMEM64 family)|nr:TVP38/TMEM64 family protein [Woeseia sp.]MBT6211328.1 TVP38/TMEM64 family protein [Woeseia sp.]
MTDATTPPVPAWKRFLPIGVIVAALAAFFGFGLQRYFTLDSLAANQETIKNYADANLLKTMLGIIVVYAAVTAISFPGAAIMTLLAGFILGTLYGGISVVIGATIGATIIFLAGRSAAGDLLAKRGGDTVAKLEAGFTKNALSYLFVLRLVPLFPFWLVNLAAAAFRVPTQVYIFATFFGIMPGTLVFASVGAGFSSITESSDIGIGVLLQPAVILPMIGLAALSLLPIIFKSALNADDKEPS